MSYREHISHVTCKAVDLSKATFTRADGEMFEQWLINYIVAHDKASQRYGGDLDLMFAWDFTYGPDGRLVDLAAHPQWDDYIPHFFLVEMEGIIRFFRERGVRLALTFNKAGEDEDDRWRFTVTHGGLWAARGKLVYGKRERIV